MMLAFAGLLIAVSTGAAPTRATSSLVTPRTLVIEHGRIHKFAQDGDFITWIGGRHYVVHLRSVSGRSHWILGNAGPGAAVGAQSASKLILGGKKAVWVKYAGVMTREAGISAAKPGHKPWGVDALGVSETSGRYLAGLAADGEQTIVYGDAYLRCTELLNCSGSEWSLAGGGVHRIVGTRSYPRPIRGIPPAFAVAASVGRVAVVPAAVSKDHPAAAPNGPVDVHDLSGRRLARVVPQGTVREVALSWPYLAVRVTRSNGANVIERYDASNEKLLSSTQMAGASNIAMGAGGIVFLVGKSIYTLHDGKPALLWRATMKPVGLSIEGRRVAWAAAGRIKALTLPS
jgi:hypothetical protein